MKFFVQSKQRVYSICTQVQSVSGHHSVTLALCLPSLIVADPHTRRSCPNYVIAMPRRTPRAALPPIIKFATLQPSNTPAPGQFCLPCSILLPSINILPQYQDMAKDKSIHDDRKADAATRLGRDGTSCWYSSDTLFGITVSAPVSMGDR